jgi:hypothetical protein
MLNYSPEREPDAKAVYQQWVRDIGEREPDGKAIYQQQWEFNQQRDAARHW